MSGSAGGLSPGCVAVHVLQEDLPGRFEFVSDESEAEHPAAHRVFFVVGLLGLGAGVGQFLGQFAHRQAKLDVSLHLSGVDAAALAVVRVGKLEEAEFNGPFGEGSVEVEQVMCIST